MAASSRSETYAAELALRMRQACGELSFGEIARRTATNRETVRRYMTGGRPSAEFVGRLCAAFGISGTWLLTGRGPRFDSGVGLPVRTRRGERVVLNGHAGRSKRSAGVS